MSPLQKIAMGLVIVVGSALVPAHPSPGWARYDVLADPVGWVLVLLGTFALVRTEDAFASSRWTAAVAGVVSVPMWLPQVRHLLDASGQWAASLPQIAFCLLLAHQVGTSAAQQSPRDAYVAKRFGLLVWGFGLLAVLPVVAIGGGVHALEPATATLSVLVDVAFVYYLFRVHRREWLGGPVPLEVRPRSRQEHDGRPPS